MLWNEPESSRICRGADVFTRDPGISGATIIRLGRRHRRTAIIDDDQARIRGTQLSSSMRPQARLFSVEIKSRKRATKPAAAASVARRAGRRDMTPLDDLPERYAPED